MEKYFFVSNDVEVEIQAHHPVRILAFAGTYCYYSAESFLSGTEVEAWINSEWVKGVLDTDSNRAYNTLRQLEAIRMMQEMNRPKLYVVRQQSAK